MRYCPNCGSRGSNNDHVCGHCGTPLMNKEEASRQVYISTEPTIPSAPAVPEKKSKGGIAKILIPIIAVCVVVATAAVLILTHVICLNHDWQDATCTKPKTCSYCDKTEGAVLEHKYQDATCTKPKTCSDCGHEEGETAEHDWLDATCTKPQTCAVCGLEEGEVIEHEWQEATCTEPKTCAQCGLTEGEELGHTRGEWTETVAPTLVEGGTEELHCTVCDEELDSRETEKKKPDIEGIGFNFTDVEFIEWVNAEGLPVDEEEVGQGTLEKENTAYLYENDKGRAVIIMNHGDFGSDGNVCAFMVYSDDNKAFSIALAAVIGEMLDSRFVAESAATEVSAGGTFYKAGMVMFEINEQVILTTTGYVAKILG